MFGSAPIYDYDVDILTFGGKWCQKLSKRPPDIMYESHLTAPCVRRYFLPPVSDAEIPVECARITLSFERVKNESTNLKTIFLYFMCPDYMCEPISV